MAEKLSWKEANVGGGQREGEAGELQSLQVSWKSFSSVRRFCSAMCIWFSRSWGQADTQGAGTTAEHTGDRKHKWGQSILARRILTIVIWKKYSLNEEKHHDRQDLVSGVGSGQYCKDFKPKIPCDRSHWNYHEKHSEKVFHRLLNSAYPSVTGTELAFSSHHSSLIAVGSFHFPR